MVKINAKHVDPFVEAAMKVVTQIAGIEVRRGHLSYKERMEPSFGLIIPCGPMEISVALEETETIQNAAVSNCAWWAGLKEQYDVGIQ